MPPDSPYGTRLGRESGKLTSAPPKFRGPYAYVYIYMYIYMYVCMYILTHETCYV